MAENEDQPPPEPSSSSQPSSPRPPSPPQTSFEDLFSDLSPERMALLYRLFPDAGDAPAGVAADVRSHSQENFLPDPMLAQGTAQAAQAILNLQREIEYWSSLLANQPMLAQAVSNLQSGIAYLSSLLTNQPVAAQVSAQAAQANPNLRSETECLTSLLAPSGQPQARSPNLITQQEMPALEPASTTSVAVGESSGASRQDLNSQPSRIKFDNPNEDGYNWRKHSKEKGLPRSYYKCTHPDCPAKRKVTHSLEGRVAEIIYKELHNHQPPQMNKRGKDVASSSRYPNAQPYNDLASRVQSGYINKSRGGTTTSYSSKDQESSQSTHDQISETSDSEEEGESEEELEEIDEDEPEPKRQCMEARHSEPSSSRRTVTVPNITIQTQSEADPLDNSYIWRGRSRRSIKTNDSRQRNYLRCATPGCDARKHAERVPPKPEYVRTTYIGSHNHDVPALKTSSRKTAKEKKTTTHRT